MKRGKKKQPKRRKYYFNIYRKKFFNLKVNEAVNTKE